jgi:hypothetical protein
VTPPLWRRFAGHAFGAPEAGGTSLAHAVFGQETTMSAHDLAVPAPGPTSAPMGERITTREQLTLVGMGLRTSNAAEVAGAGKIAAAWKAFVDGHVQAQIPNQVHATATYVAYYDFQGEQRGDYSYLVGAAVLRGGDAGRGSGGLAADRFRWIAPRVHR